MNNTTQYNATIKLLVVAVFAMIPLYVIPSGGLHIVDIPIACLSLIVLLSLRTSEIEMSMKILIPFIPFFVWIVSVETYYIITSVSVKAYLLGAAQMIYDYYLLVLFAIVFNRILSFKQKSSYVYFVLLGACATPWLMNTHSPLARWSLSFNNPNQLAYYAILILSVLIFISDEVIRNKSEMSLAHIAGFSIIFASCNVFVYISESRAGMIAVGLLDLYIIGKLFTVYKTRIAITAWFAVGVAISIYLGILCFGSNIQQSNQSVLTSRFDKKHLVDLNDMDHRIFGMLTFDSDASMIFGNGGIWRQEAVTKVSRQFKKEVHNSILGVANDYGIVGCLLFTLGGIVFVYRLRIPNKWILMVPLLMYNMTHYGLRFRLLWITLGLIAFISFSKYKDETVSAHDYVPQSMTSFQETR
jgi:hypothetical protein